MARCCCCAAPVTERSQGDGNELLRCVPALHSLDFESHCFDLKHMLINGKANQDVQAFGLIYQEQQQLLISQVV